MYHQNKYQYIKENNYNLIQLRDYLRVRLKLKWFQNNYGRILVLHQYNTAINLSFLNGLCENANRACFFKFLFINYRTEYIYSE